MEAIVLAGGLGRRLRSVVSDVPKPMAPINGRPFLEHLFDYWLGQGISRFILSVGYRRDVIQSHFGESYRGTDIVYAVEEIPLGTGGGLLRSMKNLASQELFAILNGDTYFEVNLSALTQFHTDSKAEMTMALREVADCNRYTCIELDNGGKIAALHARTSTVGAGLINGGVYLATQAAFEGIAEEPLREISLEDDVFPRMLSSSRRLYGHRSHGRFIDIGVPEDYRRAAQFLAASNAR